MCVALTISVKFPNLSELLWVAPEHLRSDDKLGSPQGDIYSFAIVCSEIVTRQNPFSASNNGENAQGKEMIAMTLSFYCYRDVHYKFASFSNVYAAVLG